MLWTAILVLAWTAAPEGLPEAQARAYEAICPNDKELPWRQIGWRADLMAAVSIAKQEKRPLLLWVAGDPPLERC
ncbi:MAG: hypothetical protein SNJ75_08110 [Gemmataceae bacterium]